MTFLERVLHKDYVHYGQHGMIENRTLYLKNRRTSRVDYDLLVANDVNGSAAGDGQALDTLLYSKDEFSPVSTRLARSTSEDLRAYRGQPFGRWGLACRVKLRSSSCHHVPVKCDPTCQDWLQRHMSSVRTRAVYPQARLTVGPHGRAE